MPLNDPLLEESCAYHAHEQVRHMELAGRYMRLYRVLMEAAFRETEPEWRIWLLDFANCCSNRQVYEQVVAAYHTSMVGYWRNVDANGPVRAVPRYPNRAHWDC